MAVRPIRIYGDPVLRQQAAEVAAVNEVVRRLIEDLRDTMHAYRGVGLAANQIGALERVLVVDVPVEGERRVELTLVNPVLSEPAETNVDEEGCLSIPGIYERRARGYGGPGVPGARHPARGGPPERCALRRPAVGLEAPIPQEVPGGAGAR